MNSEIIPSVIFPKFCSRLLLFSRFVRVDVIGYRGILSTAVWRTIYEKRKCIAVYLSTTHTTTKYTLDVVPAI